MAVLAIIMAEIRLVVLNLRILLGFGRLPMILVRKGLI